MAKAKKLVGVMKVHDVLKRAAGKGRSLTLKKARSVIQSTPGICYPPGTTTEDILRQTERCELIWFDEKAELVIVLEPKE
jgi:hypothetical protein